MKIKSTNFALLAFLLFIVFHCIGLYFAIESGRGLYGDTGGHFLRIFNEEKTQFDWPHLRHLNRIFQIPVYILGHLTEWKITKAAQSLYLTFQYLFPLTITLITSLLFYRYKKESIIIPPIIYMIAIYPAKIFTFNIADEVASLSMLLFALIVLHKDKVSSWIWAAFIIPLMVASYELSVLIYFVCFLFMFLSKEHRQTPYFWSFQAILSICAFIVLCIIYRVQTLNTDSIRLATNSYKGVNGFNLYIWTCLSICLFYSLTFIKRYQIVIVSIFGCLVLALFAITLYVHHDYYIYSVISSSSYNYRVFIIPLTLILIVLSTVNLKRNGLSNFNIKTLYFIIVLCSTLTLWNDYATSKAFSQLRSSMRKYLLENDGCFKLTGENHLEVTKHRFFDNYFTSIISANTLLTMKVQSYATTNLEYCDIIQKRTKEFLKKFQLITSQEQHSDQSNLPTSQHQ